jgi:hypothetical protein
MNTGVLWINNNLEEANFSNCLHELVWGPWFVVSVKIIFKFVFECLLVLTVTIRCKFLCYYQ